MSFGKSGGSKPVFAPGQMEMAERIFEEILGPQLFGGAPDVMGAQAARRGRQATRQGFAQRGMTGSGLEARAMGEAQMKGTQAREGRLMDLIATVLSPLGQQQKGGFNIGLTG